MIDERQSPYALAFCLLLAGVIPELAWSADGGFTADFLKPTPSAEALGPQLSQAALFYPAAAGLLALFVAWSVPRWLRGLGFIGLGGALLAFTADRAGVATAVNSQFAAFTAWDMLFLGGVTVALVAMRAQADSYARLPLSLLGAAGGAAVLAWLVVPRSPSVCESWLGLVSQQHANTIPIVRGFLRNGEFGPGTHVVWYGWWNLYLVALVVFPLLCLRVPLRRRELREGAADLAYAALVFALLSLALTAVATAALDHEMKPRSAEGTATSWQPALVAAANTARLVLPPLLLAGLALIGVSDVLKGLSGLRLPRLRRRGEQPYSQRAELREPGFVRLSTERYVSTEAPRRR